MYFRRWYFKFDCNWRFNCYETIEGSKQVRVIICFYQNFWMSYITNAQSNYIIQTQKTSKNSCTKFIVLHILVKTCQVLVKTARKYQFWLSLFFLSNFQTFIFLEFVKEPRKIHISIYYPFYFLSKLAESRTLYLSRKINK